MQDVKNITAIIAASKKISQDKREYLIDFINRTNASEALTPSEKARKISLAINAYNTYLSEAELNSLAVMIRDTFKTTVDDIIIPFRNIWDSLNFLTRPPILILLLLIILAVYLWPHLKAVK